MAAFFWGVIGHDPIQRSMLDMLAQRAPLSVWAAGATTVAILQVAAAVSGQWHIRAYALTLSFVAWSLFNGALERWGLGLIDNLTDPIWVWCLIATGCLMWQHNNHGGTGGARRGDPRPD
jgi:hypothetical protein